MGNKKAPGVIRGLLFAARGFGLAGSSPPEAGNGKDEDENDATEHGAQRHAGTIGGAAGAKGSEDGGLKR